jgi:hypothetical protein
MINGAVANILDFGASTSSTNNSAAIQAAVNSGAGIIEFPQGTFLISTAINLPAGVTLRGAGSGQFTSVGTNLTNNTVGGGCFWVTSTSVTQLDSPNIIGFTLIADKPIQLNDPTTTISDGGTSPYLMKGKIEDVACYARAPGTASSGTGISLSKCFDFEITRCSVRGFNIDLLLQGCDIGYVHTNRFWQFYGYGILEISVGNFGSQTIIQNNDIVNPITGVGATFIKSCGLHPRIHDNYLECNSVSTAAIAIDLTNIGCPTYGSNTPATPIEISVRDNRIDGQPYFSTAVYRLDSSNPVQNTIIHDTGTTNPPSIPPLITGNNGYLPAIYSGGSGVLCSYDIRFPNVYSNSDYTPLNVRTGILPALSNGLTITSATLTLCQQLNSASAVAGLGIVSGESIAVLAAFGTSAIQILALPVYGTNSHPLEPGAIYSIFVTARSVSSESCNFGPYISSGGSSLASFALTPSYQTILVGTFTAPAIGATCGTYFQRVTATGTINIQSVEFIKQISNGYGTPTSVSKTSSLPGTAASLAQVGGTLAALIADLKNQGVIGA